MIPEIRKILYATDLSPNSAYAFRYAINSAKKNGAKIIILHVLEQLSPGTRAMVNAYIDQEEQRAILEKNVTFTKNRMRKRLKTFCDRELKGDPECTDRVEFIEVCEGFPADEILRKVDEFNCDAIVMGTHGKGMINHTFLGSTTKRVLRRVRKPVFIIPLPEGETEITFHDV